MLNREGFKILASFGPEKLGFTVFLLANFDLKKFTAMNPRKLIEFGINEGFGVRRNETTLNRRVDFLVKSGLLEYGPFVRGWKGVKIPTIRIRQHLLTPARSYTAEAKRVKERKEREALLEPPAQPTG